MHDLTINEARKLVLASQGIHRESDFKTGQAGVIEAINTLSYIQIDTISVIERAHHHTLWNRLKNYDPTHLDAALKDRSLFEYWSHAAAFLPMEDYRYSLPRKNALANGETHWYKREPKEMAYVLDRIRAEGSLQASDFAQARSVDGGWGQQKPAKRALEQLFMEGELMISARQGFKKVFDLTERVLPDHIDRSTPSEQEFIDHLIQRYLHANGLGTASEISYLRKRIKPKVQSRCKALVANGELTEIKVGDLNYFALSNFDDRLEKKISRQKIKILSPFDNLLIQRQRMRDLFDFDYLIECYVTKQKRKYGYFVLPILQGQEFVGRLDAKIDRKTGILNILSLYIETKNVESMLHHLKPALKSFMEFNGGHTTQIEKAYLNGKPYKVII